MVMTINEKLCTIQTALKAPKSQYNKFGNYNYRNCEDILEALKPLLKANDATITLTDEIINMGDRFYVKATATFSGFEGDSIIVTAFAREEPEKKGMDGSQVTGAASSYARKYALNGLFAIDDTKDSDTTNTGSKAAESPKVQSKAQKTDKPNNDYDDMKFKCANCGAVLVPVPKKDGSSFSVREWSEMTKTEFGIPVCKTCYKKLMKKPTENTNAN